VGGDNNKIYLVLIHAIIDGSRVEFYWKKD
jgi:hypothetical protein